MTEAIEKLAGPHTTSDQRSARHSPKRWSTPRPGVNVRGGGLGCPMPISLGWNARRRGGHRAPGLVFETLMTNPSTVWCCWPRPRGKASGTFGSWHAGGPSGRTRWCKPNCSTPKARTPTKFCTRKRVKTSLLLESDVPNADVKCRRTRVRDTGRGRDGRDRDGQDTDGRGRRDRFRFGEPGLATKTAVTGSDATGRVGLWVGLGTALA